MEIKNVKGIVWDLDGTLIDSFQIVERIIADVIKDSGHAMPSREFMLLNFHGSLEETVQRILDIKSSKELDDVMNVFLAKQKLHYAGDLDEHLFKDSVMLSQKAAKHGIHQLVVTNRAHKRRGNASPRIVIASTVLADSIKEVYPSDEVEFRKPDKRSMGDWMERYNLMPSEILVIGDQFVDAQLALNVGARGLLVKRHEDIPHLNRFSKEEMKNITLVDNLEGIEFVN